MDESEFLHHVRRLSHIGYGRMLRIVSHEYYRAAVKDGLCPPSGVLVPGTCVGLLPKDEQRDFVSGYEADTLFR